MNILDDFFIRALIGGLGVSLAAGPLGCFVVWRRMAYFGDATAHAALLGVTLSLVTDLPVTLGVGLVSVAMAVLIALATGRTYAMDTVLGVASHGALALGIVAVSLLPGVRVDLIGVLFGDILAVTRSDLLLIWIGAAAITGLMAWRWKRLLLSTLNEDLAASAGVDPDRERLILTLALALLVAVALKVVGVLLITAMLLIPAAAARANSETPESMVRQTVLLGGIAVVLGLEASLHADLPAGPAVVTSAIALLLGSNGLQSLRRLLVKHR
jgi:zinc transport system permease protein